MSSSTQGQAPCACPDLRRNVAIGADFGATFSDVAARVQLVCETHGAGVPTVVIREDGKFPTTIGYNRTTHPRFRFISPHDDLTGDIELKYFKLLAADPDTKRHFVDDNDEVLAALDQCKDSGSSVMILGAYIKGLLDYALESLGGIDLDDPSTQAVFILGYPAVYDHPYSTNLLDQALDVSQIKDRIQIQVIHEHAAGARTALFASDDGMRKAQSEGASVVVADVGGITIDVGVYDFSTHSSSPDKNHFDCAPQGTLLLDQCFENLIRAKLVHAFGGRASEVWDKMSVEVMQTWHKNIKPGFHPNAPHDAYKTTFLSWKEDIVIEVFREELQRLFDEAIQRIAVAVFPFWTKCKCTGLSPKVIYLAGGLSLNNYVFQELARRFGVLFPADWSENPRIVQSLGWGVVAPGACITGAYLTRETSLQVYCFKPRNTGTGRQ